MNNKIFFMNNGEFDVETMLTFGISMKSGDDTIGKFGTGFKYAVAIILAKGGSIKVESMGKEYVFSADKRTLVRKDDNGDDITREISFVQCNGVDCGFTTLMGQSWEPWMAYRELRCNAADEKGVVSRVREDYDTVITVDCQQVSKAHDEADNYFVGGHLIGVFSGVEVYDRPSSQVYYQGVAVHQLEEKSKYSYNIKSYIDLTEDRTSKYEYQVRFAIQRCMMIADNEDFISNVIDQTQGENFYEKTIGCDTTWDFSETFANVAIRKQASAKGVSDVVSRIIQKHIDRNGEWPEFQLNEFETAMYEKAKSFLLGMDVNVEDYPVKFVTGLGHGVLGRAHRGQIFLSKLPFEMGMKQLVATLLEEWVHLNQDCDDFDRTMQNWLYNKVISMGQMLNGTEL